LKKKLEDLSDEYGKLDTAAEIDDDAPAPYVDTGGFV